jgi:phenol/toluene 2-monooxygenase (NADH) P0/A0
MVESGGENGVDWGDARVRVTGIRRSRFVEFEFSLEPELSVELVMPYAEFQRFCEEHHVRTLPGEEEAALALTRLAAEHRESS